MTAQELTHRLGGQWHRTRGTACCPAHDDRTPSLSLADGDDGRVLVHCHAGCRYEEIVAAAGLSPRDLMRDPLAAFPPARESSTPAASSVRRETNGSTPAGMETGRREVAAYPYTDEGGNELFTIHRLQTTYSDGSVGKTFRASRPGNDSSRTWNLVGVRRVPYRFQELVAASPGTWVMIVEGEKDVQTLTAHGIVATTNNGGAGKWPEEFAEHFRGRKVAVLPDNDAAGRAHGQHVAHTLAGIATVVKVLRLPDLEDKGDVTDWLAAGNDTQRLGDLIEAAPDWTPSSAAEPRASGDSEGWEEPTRFRMDSRPEFPLDTLTPWLRDMVAAQAEFAQTPIGLPAGVALASLATAAARRFEIELAPGYREPLNLFVVVTSRPGTRKSSVFKAFVLPLIDWETRKFEEVRPAYEAALSTQRIGELKRAMLEKKIARSSGLEERQSQEELQGVLEELRELKVPVPPRLVIDDATPEKIVGLMQQHGGGIAVLSPEGEIFEIMSGRYNSQGRPNLGVFLKGHAGDPLIVDRIGRPAEHISKPHLTIGLTIQPDVLGGLTTQESFRGRGLLGRFLYVLPDDLLGHRRTGANPVPSSVRQAYHDAVTRLLELREDECFGPTVLTLSPQATEAHSAFAIWLEPQLAEGAPFGHLTDWAGKLPGAVARLSGLLHVADGATLANGIRVCGSVMERAIQLGRYFLAHAVAAFSVMGSDPRIERASRVIRWLKQNGYPAVSRRDIFNGCRSEFRTVEEIPEIELLLVEHGYLRQKPEPQSRGRGRPRSPVLEVNPHILDRPSNCAVSANCAEGRRPAIELTVEPELPPAESAESAEMQTTADQADQGGRKMAPRIALTGLTL